MESRAAGHHFHRARNKARLAWAEAGCPGACTDARGSVLDRPTAPDDRTPREQEEEAP